MRVMLDTTFAVRAPLSGTGVYIRRVMQALRAAGEVELVEAVNPARRAPAGGGAGSVRNLLADQWWTAVELPRRARVCGAEVIHQPLPTAPALRARGTAGGAARVVTVTDLAFERLPECFDRGYRAYARSVLRAAVRAADRVICISRSTAADVEALWGVPASRITVALLGPGQELAARERIEPPRHFLYVGDGEPRKNLATLLDAYARYRVRAPAPLELLVAGSAPAAGDGVRVLGRVASGELAELFAGAAALVHPSLLEGFGLTPLEAMRLGTPVIAARSPGITEVCGEAARYCEPRDPVAFADAMAALADDAGLRASLRAAGSVRAESFSWSACARAHTDAYSLVKPS